MRSMLDRLKKLPISILVIFMVLLLCASYALWTRSELKSRVLHACYSQNKALSDCYISYYQDISEKLGTKKALQKLHENLKVDKKLNEDCHMAAHVIGRNAFHEFGSIAKAYSLADYECWGGYLHGVVEASMSRKKLSDISPLMLRTMCDGVKELGETSFAHFSCVHGIGHALMYVSHNDLLSALIRCDELQDEWEIRQCVNGSFMENTLADSDHPSKFQPKDDLNFPCTIASDKNKDVCYQVQSKFILDHYQWDFKQSFVFCDGLLKTEYKQLCAQGLGAGVSVYAAYDPVKISNLCALAHAPLKNECLYGALTDLEGKTGKIELGHEVCKNVKSDEFSECEQILHKAHIAFPGATKSGEGWSDATQ